MRAQSWNWKKSNLYKISWASFSEHGEGRAAHHRDDHEGQDEDEVRGAAPRSQAPGSEPEPLHDKTGNEDSYGSRKALAQATSDADGSGLLPEVILEVLRGEGEVSDDTLEFIQTTILASNAIITNLTITGITKQK